MLLLKSIALDVGFLKLKKIGIWWKFVFITTKYLALIPNLFGKESYLNIAKVRFNTRNLSDIGTLQSSIIDTYSELVIKGEDYNGKIVIDVGSNVGQFACAIKIFWPDAIVHCFEPDPIVYKALETNLSQFENVELNNVGVGAEKGILPFYVNEISLMSSFMPWDGAEETAVSIKPISIVTLNEYGKDL